ncbi:hypothetical protein EDD37DRAFT_611456 [Exophiala viscosa]|uniref:uncharacterized protein n=1 Tax=Exophiala viscosa TaxID=2486360 RepID=UPI00219C0D31|nr:hypothetical protein EDD37DRAFT_611456 [Exophiala viscosa]
MSQPKKQKLHHPSDDSRSVIAVNGGLREHLVSLRRNQIPTSDPVRQAGSPPGSQRPDGVPDEPNDVPEVHHETSRERNDVLAEQNSRHISDQPDGVPDEPDEGLEEHHEISQERGGVLVEQNGRQLSGQPDDVHNEPNEVLEEQNETSPEQDDVQVEQTGGQKSDQSEDTDGFVRDESSLFIPENNYSHGMYPMPPIHPENIRSIGANILQKIDTEKLLTTRGRQELRKKIGYGNALSSSISKDSGLVIICNHCEAGFAGHNNMTDHRDRAHSECAKGGLKECELKDCYEHRCAFLLPKTWLRNQRKFAWRHSAFLQMYIAWLRNEGLKSTTQESLAREGDEEAPVEEHDNPRSLVKKITRPSTKKADVLAHAVGEDDAGW